MQVTGQGAIVRLSTGFAGYGNITARFYCSSGLIVDGKTIDSFSGSVIMNSNNVNSTYSTRDAIYVPFYNGFSLYANANAGIGSNYTTSSITAYYYKFNVPT